MGEEPYRLTRWKPTARPLGGHLFTCARPGRSLIVNGRPVGKVSDECVDVWVRGLPGSSDVVIVSLLGHKPNGRSEFSFYSFRRGLEPPPDRGTCPTFQEWLDARYGTGRYSVIEHPTTDRRPIEPDTLNAVCSTIESRLREGRTVVVMDSGGAERTGRVCRALHFVKDQ